MILIFYRRVYVVADYAYTRISNFAIEYLREKETVLVCSQGRVGKKRGVENLVTLSLQDYD